MTRLEKHKAELENLEKMANDLKNPKSKSVRLLTAAGAHLPTMIDTLDRLVKEARSDYKKEELKSKKKKKKA